MPHKLRWTQSWEFAPMAKSAGNMRPHGGTSNVGNTRYGAPLTYAKPADHVEVVPVPEPTPTLEELKAGAPWTNEGEQT